jgi:hypothetical protein
MFVMTGDLKRRVFRTIALVKRVGNDRQSAACIGFHDWP